MVLWIKRSTFYVLRNKTMLRPIEARLVNKLLGNSIPKPTYTTDGAAAMDLRACIEAPIILKPGRHVLVNTGLAINMMDSSRSGDCGIPALAYR